MSILPTHFYATTRVRFKGVLHRIISQASKHRISNRLGLVCTKEPEETEFSLKSNLPKESWSKINTLFVTLGQNICKPTKPDCNKCNLHDYCKFFKENNI